MVGHKVPFMSTLAQIHCSLDAQRPWALQCSIDVERKPLRLSSYQENNSGVNSNDSPNFWPRPNYRITLLYKLKVALFSFANKQVPGCLRTERGTEVFSWLVQVQNIGSCPFIPMGRPGEGGPNFKAGCLLQCVKQNSNLSALINFPHAHYALGLTELSWEVLSHLRQQASAAH